ncbi:FG-GAP-like repeat-containing protein [Gymnodinialimonas sp. 2305UL16-5]|uniref:FG-GAP-like repeat-containing protein n=1 Tax=Gymnodinialimonas mytili TaxID=3126503 RepID=UPI0030A28165
MDNAPQSYDLTSSGKPVYSYDQISDYLTTGFWNDFGTTPRSFDVQTSGTITFNVGGLTQYGAETARKAFEAWTAVSGLQFQEVLSTSAAQIVFDDNELGAFAWSTTTFGGNIIKSNVNVHTSWASYGDYYYQTYMHEIGHALGLGHTGNYNGNATYARDARYANDSWQTSVMSYFSQSENTATNASFAFLATLQLGDIAAIHSLYGTPLNVQTGNTIYGEGATTTQFGMDLSGQYAVAIVDSGGIDLINLASSGASQRLSLVGESYSSINGKVENLSIARTTVIENVATGWGADSILGNSADNQMMAGAGSDTVDGASGSDRIYGEQGNDYLYGGLGNDLIDGGSGADLVYGGWDADTLFGGVGNDTLNGDLGNDVLVGGTNTPPSLKIVAHESATLTVNDFGGAWWADKEKYLDDINGDGQDDLILFRGLDDMWSIYTMLGNDDGTFGAVRTTSNTDFGGAWWRDKEKIIGDINGDGYSDIVAFVGLGGRDQIHTMLGQADGTFGEVKTTQHTFGGAWWAPREKFIGDVNGDGFDDLVVLRGLDDLSQNLYTMLGTSDGTFGPVVGTSSFLASAWWADKEKLLADINGDGFADLVVFSERDSHAQIHTLLGTADGSFGDLRTTYTEFGATWWADKEKLADDVDGDGNADIVILRGLNDQQSIHTLHGSDEGTFEHVVTSIYDFGGAWWAEKQKFLGDVDGDGRSDIVGMHEVNNFIVSLSGRNNGTFGAGDGNDNLNGDLGNDFLDGSEGDDTLTGGDGADVFAFNGEFGNDTVTDFMISVPNEKIDLSEVAEITSFSDLISNHLTQVSSNTVINDGLGNSITLIDVNASLLTIDDFVF